VVPVLVEPAPDARFDLRKVDDQPEVVYSQHRARHFDTQPVAVKVAALALVVQQSMSQVDINEASAVLTLANVVSRPVRRVGVWSAAWWTGRR
jgi:hypothetical protein